MCMKNCKVAEPRHTFVKIALVPMETILDTQDAYYVLSAQREGKSNSRMSKVVKCLFTIRKTSFHLILATGIKLLFCASGKM